MPRQPLDHDESSVENDPVWKLLGQSPRVTATPRFVDDTVRAARLAGQASPWWARLLAPIPLASLATTAAACAIAFIGMRSTPSENGLPQTADSHAFAEIQEIAETEALISAVDDLDKFSDMELVSLIGL